MMMMMMPLPCQPQLGKFGQRTLRGEIPTMMMMIFCCGLNAPDFTE